MIRYDCEVVPLENIELDQKLNYSERPIAITDRKTKVLRRKVVNLVQVQWQHHKGSDLTWEHEDEMRADYPYLFEDGDFGGEVHSEEGRIITPRNSWYVFP